MGAAVVAVEEDERAGAHAGLVQSGHHPPDLVVEARNHRGVGAPGGVLDGGVAGDVLRRGLVRGVRRVEREVEVEGHGGVVPFDEAGGVLPQERGGVPLLVHGLVVAEPVEHAALAVGEVVEFADHRAVLVLEPALPGPVLRVRVAEVPLADDGGEVPRVLQALGQEPLIGVQPVRRDRGNDRGLQAVAEGVAARHQAGPRGRAHGLCVEAGEDRAALRQRVEVGSLDVGAAVEPDVLPAKVVGHDVHDVGAKRRLGASGRSEETGQHQRQEERTHG